MDNLKPGDEHAQQTPSPLRYGVFILLQALLFLSATAALSLFYRSYRPDDFSRTFIVIGLLLSAPWFLISLLPTVFGLQDRELSREIFTRQLVSMAVIVCVLLGLAFAIGYHQELWAQASLVVMHFVQFVMGTLQSFVFWIGETIQTLVALFNDYVLPLFTR